MDSQKEVQSGLDAAFLWKCGKIGGQSPDLYTQVFEGHHTGGLFTIF